MSLYIYIEQCCKTMSCEKYVICKKMNNSKLNDLNKPPNESCPCLNHLPNVIVKTMSKCIYISISTLSMSNINHVMCNQNVNVWLVKYVSTKP